MSYYVAEDAKSSLGTFAHRFLLYAISVLIVTILSLVMLPKAANAQSNLQVLACDGSTGSTLDITEPVSDSTVATPQLTIAGAVTQATQIEVYIDGTLNDIVPIDFGATSFTTTVELSSGTRTIQLIAVDLCQIASASDEVIVTYVPQVTPTPGNEVPTEVPGTEPNGPPVTRPTIQSPAAAIIDTIILDPLEKIGTFFNILTPLDVEGASSIPYTQRFALGASGVAILIGSQTWTNLIASSATRMNAQFNFTPKRLRIMKGSLFTVGSLLILLMFTL